jgi:hypothetical protein
MLARLGLDKSNSSFSFSLCYLRMSSSRKLSGLKILCRGRSLLKRGSLSMLCFSPLDRLFAIECLLNCLELLRLVHFRLNEEKLDRISFLTFKIRIANLSKSICLKVNRQLK